MTNLSLFQDPDLPVQPKRGAALFASIAFHAAAGMALFALLQAAPQSRTTGAIHKRRFQVQLIALQVPPPLPAPAPHKTNKLLQTSPPGTGVTGTHFAFKGSAPQTLIVADAPRTFVLKKSIPLPLAMPHLQQRVWTPQTLTTPPPDLQDRLLTANILSLPDEISRPVSEILIPKVSQLAGGAGGEASMQPDSVETAAAHIGMTRLDLPRDGQNQFSLTGASVLTFHSELLSQRRSKIVSTVYINLGLKKNWSLEYSPLASTTDPSAGQTPLESPWAYEIYRPDDVSVPAETDAVLVAGVLGVSGQLDDLQLLLPSDWQGKSSLIRALTCWRFRPAARGSQPVPVNVLFVIPKQPT